MSDLDQSPAQPFELLSRGPTFGNLKNYNLLANGPPGGANGNVQYNNAGIFGGLTNTQLTSLLDPFTSVLKGAVPASGGGTSKFLRADGTFQVPSSTGSFDFFINVKDFGATGDGSTNDTAAVQAAVDAAFGAPAGAHFTANATQNKVLYFPPGNYRVQSILFYGVFGGIVKGAGRFATKIERWDNSTPSDGLFRTDGCSYMKFEDMWLSGPFEGLCFDLNWSGSGSNPNSNLQANTFQNILFDLASHGAHYGMRIAAGGGGSMGSENLFLNCHFTGNASSGQYGIYIGGQNALQQTIIGGNFQSLDYGIWAAGGIANAVISVGFQESVSYDIRCNDDTSNTIAIIGCRTESPNFVTSGLTTHISACHQVIATSGIFLFSTAGAIHVDGCLSVNGKIHSKYSSHVTVNNSRIGGDPYLTFESVWSYANNGAGNETYVEFNNCVVADSISIRKLMAYPDNLTDPAGPNMITITERSAGALTDGNVAGLDFSVGDRIWQSVPVSGGSMGWVCTTAGTAGSTAVFKAMANLAA